MIVFVNYKLLQGAPPVVSQTNKTPAVSKTGKTRLSQALKSGRSDIEA